MAGSSSSSRSSPSAGSAGFSAFADSLRAGRGAALLRLAAALVAVSLLWAAAAPAYARGLAWLARPLASALEGSPGTRYEVEGSRLVAYRPVRLAGQERSRPLVQPLWTGARSFGLPLLAALVLASPGWSWRRRARALGIGLALLSVTQVAQLLVAIEATQQSPVMTPEGPVHLPGHSPVRQPIFYWLYYFFDLMGRGFFALLIYCGLIAFIAEPPAATRAASGRNAACPCGSGLKFKRCHGGSR
jgi:hypothetical protein